MAANDHAAAAVMNVLTMLTSVVPWRLSLDEMDARDVADAFGNSDFFFSGAQGQVTYLPDGRVVTKW
jgi:hypothetical protein